MSQTTLVCRTNFSSSGYTYTICTTWFLAWRCRVFLNIVFTGYCFCEYVITFTVKPEVCCLYIVRDNNMYTWKLKTWSKNVCRADTGLKYIFSISNYFTDFFKFLIFKICFKKWDMIFKLCFIVCQANRSKVSLWCGTLSKWIVLCTGTLYGTYIDFRWRQRD
jgi:hypothetical protein